MPIVLLNEHNTPLWVIDNEYSIKTHDEETILLITLSTIDAYVKKKRVYEGIYTGFILHRLDGPAIIRKAVSLLGGEYFINGRQYKNVDLFNEEVERLKILKEKSQESGLELAF